jgi:hypothetical protein
MPSGLASGVPRELAGANIADGRPARAGPRTDAMGHVSSSASVMYAPLGVAGFETEAGCQSRRRITLRGKGRTSPRVLLVSR